MTTTANPATDVTLPNGVTACTKGRTVTLAGNTFPIKDQIKAAGFKWSVADKKWTGGKTSLGRLAAALQCPVAAPVTAVRTFPPTLEQEAILAAVQTRQDVAIEAFAGTGKSSTLELIARAHASERILVIVFNKSAQIDVAARMPRWVETRTFDSLGFAGAPETSVTKFRTQREVKPWEPGAPIRRAADIAAWLGIDRNPIVAEQTRTVVAVDGTETVETYTGPVNPAHAAALAIRTVEWWCTSADPQILDRHVHDDAPITPSLAAAVVPVAQKVWDDVTSPAGRIRVTNSHLTKMWALSQPDFTRPGSGPKVTPTMLMVDEAQDTAPVVAAVVAAQKMQTIVVGDPYQAIYAWRGATDYLSQVKVEHRLPLTQSWRFGPQVAGAANKLLVRMGARNALIGAGKPGMVVDAYTMADASAVLCRTNAGVLSEIIAVMASGRQAAVTAGTKADLVALAKTARWLMALGTPGEPKPTTVPEPPARVHEDLAAYSSWTDLDRAIRMGEADRAAERLYETVEQHGIDTIDDIAARVLEDTGNLGPHVTVITTAHKAKGGQWDRVRIGDDFPQPRKNSTGAGMTEPGFEEQKLAYVAVTRAKSVLDPGSLAWALDGAL